jgi:HAD superfamily hydrolase (TIGR01509 family)
MTTHPTASTRPSPRSAARVSAPGDLAAVLWDMDGTLVDTEPFWIAAETELVTSNGGTWTQENAHALVGLDLLDAAAYIRRVGGVDMEPAAIVELMMERVIEQMAAAPPWRPGALDLLAALGDAGVPSVLVTMSWRRLVGAVVELLPPGTFAATVAGDEVERGKPHPEPYLAAADILGVAPTSCVAIEDSPTGARSARSAGCAVLGVPHVVDIPSDLVDATARSLTTVTVETLRSLVRG